MEVETLTKYLREAEQHYNERRAKLPEHHWSDWYAAYIHAREQGKAEDECCDHAGQYLEDRIHWY
jgi:hypothetical protein